MGKLSINKGFPSATSIIDYHKIYNHGTNLHKQGYGAPTTMVKSKSQKLWILPKIGPQIIQSSWMTMTSYSFTHGGGTWGTPMT
jgi:hypothetical protein